MMAFIEQEANEKAEEIDAKVYSDAYTHNVVSILLMINIPIDKRNMMSLFLPTRFRQRKSST